jgi:hypothetical protein
MIVLPLKPPLTLLLSALSSLSLLGACRSPAPDPAPPPASYDLASAPPGARGARAAGTDAAPPPPSEGVLHVPGTDDEEEAEPEEEDAGSDGDAGLAPDAGGVAL